MSGWRTALRAAAVTAGILAAPGAAYACSVCLAGDPIFTTQGASAQQAGDVNVYFELRAWRKTSGLLPHGEEPPPGPEEEGEGGGSGGHAGHEHEEEEEGAHESDSPGQERGRYRRLDLHLSWTPLDRLTLTANLPWAFTSIVEREADGSTHTSLDGFGDASLAVSAVAWRNRDVLPSTWLEVRAWGKAPTGRDSVRVDGEQDPHLQPGTGSWDFGFGLAATHRLAWGALYGSAFRRFNTEGSLDYEYGDVWLANAALEVPVGHTLGIPALARLTAGTEINFRQAGYDHQDGERYDDSGGAIVYVTPSLRFRLPALFGEQEPSLRGAVQIPTTQRWLNGEQDEGALWSLGLLWPF